jgi:hypothetical protein
MLAVGMGSDATRDQLDDAPSQEAPLEAPVAVAPPPRDAHWWGETVLEVDRVARAVAGPLTIWARRRPREWAIASTRGRDGHAGDAERGHEVPDDDIAEDATVERFSFADAPPALLLRPSLADRSMVVRPEGSLAIPSGERVTLFVSSPVWVTVSVGRATRHDARRRRGGGRRPPPRREDDAVEDVRLTEIPSYRLSDTWFGSSTLVGELCYSSRTAGRLSLDELPVRPHRAITPVTIDNRAATALVLQRLLVPLPTLALYADRDGALWTQGVTMTREADVDQAVARVDAAAPAVRRGPAQRLAEPREVAAAGAMVRAFSRFFRGAEGHES